MDFIAHENFLTTNYFQSTVLSNCLVYMLLNSNIVFVVTAETTSITQEDVVTQPSASTSASENQNEQLKGSE